MAMNIYEYEVKEHTGYVASINIHEAEKLVMEKHGSKSLHIKQLNDEEILHLRCRREWAA